MDAEDMQLTIYAKVIGTELWADSAPSRCVRILTPDAKDFLLDC